MTCILFVIFDLRTESVTFLPHFVLVVLLLISSYGLDVTKGSRSRALRINLWTNPTCLCIHRASNLVLEERTHISGINCSVILGEWDIPLLFMLDYKKQAPIIWDAPSPCPPPLIRLLKNPEAIHYSFNVRVLALLPWCSCSSRG